MAKRRCFSIDLIESTSFRRLSHEAKCLYFGLMAHADDEGVVVNQSIPMCLYQIGEEVLDELIESDFLIQFNDILIIKHWHLHNRIQPTKKIPSNFQDELSSLFINNRREYDFSINCLSNE